MVVQESDVPRNVEEIAKEEQELLEEVRRHAYAYTDRQIHAEMRTDVSEIQKCAHLGEERRKQGEKERKENTKRRQ